MLGLHDRTMLPLDDDDPDMMQGVALFADSPTRTALKRPDLSSPAAGASRDSGESPPEFKRPNLQVSPASRNAAQLRAQQIEHNARQHRQNSLANAANMQDQQALGLQHSQQPAAGNHHMAAPPPPPTQQEASAAPQSVMTEKNGNPAAAPASSSSTGGPGQTNSSNQTTAASAKRRWSKQEDEKLCAAVKTVGLQDWKTIAEVYMAGHDLSDAQCMHRWQKVLRPGLVKGAFCEKEDKVIVDCLREGGLKRRWTKQEDEKLCLAVKAVGPHDWKQIAEVHLAGHGRSDVQCLHRWQKVLRAGLVKGAFTEDEDRIIIDCMREGGLTWMQIADRIPGRIGKQCRERWTNHLDPNLKKGGWTHEEDTILAEAQHRWGNAWTKIAKLLPGRAENAVKNRWNSAFRRKKSAMFGKAQPAADGANGQQGPNGAAEPRDTAAIARARVAMEIIDRDEKEPNEGNGAKATRAKRTNNNNALAATQFPNANNGSAASSDSNNNSTTNATSGPSGGGGAAHGATGLLQQQASSTGGPNHPASSSSTKRAPHAPAANGKLKAGAAKAGATTRTSKVANSKKKMSASEARAALSPPSPSDALELFGTTFTNKVGCYDDSFLSLDCEVSSPCNHGVVDDCELDVNFDALEVATGCDPVDLTGHTPLSEPASETDLKLDAEGKNFLGSPFGGAPNAHRAGSGAASGSGSGSSSSKRAGSPTTRNAVASTTTAAAAHHKLGSPRTAEDHLAFFESGLIFGHRTGLTPSGPMAKTPAGMLHGLSPLHRLSSGGANSLAGSPVSSSSSSSSSNTKRRETRPQTNQNHHEHQSANAHVGNDDDDVDDDDPLRTTHDAQQRSHGAALPDTEDLAIQLPVDDDAAATSRQQEPFPADRAARRASSEFISPNGHEYHAAWGLPAPEVKLPPTVSKLFANKSPRSQQHAIQQAKTDDEAKQAKEIDNIAQPGPDDGPSKTTEFLLENQNKYAPLIAQRTDG